MSGKEGVNIFANCCPIFESLSLTDLAINFSKAVIKYHTTPQRVATLACEILMSEKKQQQPETYIMINAGRRTTTAESVLKDFF